MQRIGAGNRNSELDKPNSFVWVVTESRLGNWSQFHAPTPRASALPCEIPRVRARKLPGIFVKRSGILRLTELASEADPSRPATTRREDTGGAAKASLPWRLSSLASLVPTSSPWTSSPWMPPSQTGPNPRSWTGTDWRQGKAAAATCWIRHTVPVYHH
nr:uncharacterized protein LOC127302706 isoform X2 [Lolium perenne]